jgi:hypothetical protein
MQNVMIRKGLLVSRPGMDWAKAVPTPDTKPCLNLTSFQDELNGIHTIAWTESHVYALTPFPPNSFHWNMLSAPTYIVGDNTFSVMGGGSGYVVGDIVFPVQAGAFGAVAQVMEIGAGGAITATGLDLVSPGNGYHTAANVPTTTTGNGTGCTVGFNAVTLGVSLDLNSTGLPYALAKVNNSVYFCNGSTPLLYTDGEASLKIAGSVPGACRYLTVNAGHMIGAYWTEPAPLTTGIPQSPAIFTTRVRWSDSNNFNEWSELVPTATAGLADLATVPHSITGLSTIGNNSYIYRTNGISVMSPTGNAASPFYISNYSAAPKGEGNVYPYTLTSHNNIDRFVGQTDIWAFDGSSFRSLAEGRVSTEIFNDLTLMEGLVVNDPRGTRNTPRGIITTFLDEGYVYLAYILSIPLLNKAWVLNIVENTWSTFTWPKSVAQDSLTLQALEEVYTS